MVSIILCTFNRAHMLRETLASILAQTYTDFELLIIDDGSTDHTQELLSEYKDMRIRSFVFEENHFYCAAANFGMTKARGEYIAFATSDDLWEPKKLEKQIAYLEKRKDCGACFTYVHIIDENGENADDKNQALFEVLRKTFYTRRDWVQRFIFDGNCLCHPTAVVRREVMEKVGGYNLYYSLLADMELWLRIVRYYPIHVVEEGLVEYRYFENGKQQLSGIGEKKITKSLNEHMMIRRNFLTDLTDEEMLEFFADCFQYKEALSHQELEIEKAFLLMSCVRDLPELRILGMEKFEQLLRESEYVHILKETYHLRVQDIYAWNTEHFYMDYGIHTRLGERDRTIAEQEEEIKNLSEQAEDLWKTIDTLRQALEDERRKVSENEARADELKMMLEDLKEELLQENRKYTWKEKEWKEAVEASEKAQNLLNQALLEKLRLKEEKKFVLGRCDFRKE